MNTAFNRALSPLASVLSVSNENKTETALIARQVALSAADTVNELIEMVPQDYRTDLRPELINYAAIATKLCATRAVLHKLQEHVRVGTLPPSIKSAPPALQLTKEFKDQAGAVAAQRDMTEAHTSYCRSILLQQVALKEKEVAALDGHFDPAKIWEKLKTIVTDRHAVLAEKGKLPCFDKNPETQEWVFNGSWSVNPVLGVIYDQVKQDMVTYVFRILSIVTARESIASKKANAKKDLKKAADVEMRDGTVAGPSIQSLVDKAINTRVKTLRSYASKVSTRSSGSRLILTMGNFPASHHARKGESNGQETHPQAPLSAFERHPNWEGSVSSPTRWAPYPQEEGKRRRLLQGEGRSAQGQGCEEGIGSSILSGAVAPFEDTRLSADFRYDAPHTYPDWMLTVPQPVAVQIILHNTPINVIEASRYRSNIHCNSGVDVPLRIQHQLSVGMKFMFHSPRNVELINDAWQDFTERVRWRLFFAFKGEDNSLYDPDYEVPRFVKRDPPSLPAYIEMGLDLGRNFVKSTISKIPVEDARNAYRSLIPDARQVQEFLVGNDYVVTNTDKNLGLAVSKRSWILEKCLDLLDDRNNYEHMHPLMAQQILDSQCTQMEEIAILCEQDLPNGDQIGTFMRHRITDPKEKHAVPVFYGIPKIHKEPIKMRPIIPCHSAIQNPAAKYISKKLKPLIRAAPTIIHGSKDLAIKLSKLELDRHRRWFLVTGDVVAFYPNIDIELCLDIVTTLYEEFEYGVNGATTDLEKKEMRIFLKCLRTGNTNLITRFLDKMYRQTRGLAMGVADSPDLANLFGYWFERELGVLKHPSIPFYGRYIDDCLAIVYASTEQEVMNIVSNIKFGNCVIEWNVSESHIPFLDMQLYRSPYDNSLQHLPYRKARNHMERIPWISHHPLDVKRGTYIGEMSRLATLSSTLSHYQEAIRSLAALYSARGYPSDLVARWTRDNITTRWQKRLTVTERDADEVLVLKTVFNTAWNYFSAKELGETVLGYWRDYIIRAENSDYNVKFPMFSASHGGLDGVASDLCSELLTVNGRHLMPDVRKIDILNRRMITSRKRTRNLFDLTSLWKKTVIARVEHDALAQDIPNSNPYVSSSSSSSSDSNDLEHMYLDVGF